MNHWRMLSMLLLGAILSGCHASPWAAGKNEPSGANAVADANKEANKSGSEANTAKIAANTGTSATPQKSGDSPGNSVAGNAMSRPSAGGTAPGVENAAANAQSLQEVMAEIRELGVLDPEQQNKLLEDLRQTDPALWPLMVKQVRAVVAYRRKSMDQGHSSPQGSLSAPLPPGGLARNSAAGLREEEENAPLVMPLGDDPRNVAQNSFPGGTNRLPPVGKMPRTPLKNGLRTSLPTEDAPGAMASAVVSERKASGLKSAAAKSRDLRSLDAKSFGAEDQVTQASFESPAVGDDSAKACPPGKAVAGFENGDTAEGQTSGDEWRGLLEQSIKALEAETAGKPKTAEDLAKQARLRMLYAAAGRREEASKPISTAPPAMQDFWTKEMYGLSVLLDTERTPDAMSRAAEAKQHLSEGFSRLGEMAPLVVRNISFCTLVSSYGCYTPFKKYEFLPGQEVLLYAEVENFGIESTAKGYHTSLRSSYQILDKNGQRIADHAMSTTEEYCQNPRRDFFIGYQLRMPSRINPGSYTLQLTIEDLKSQKVGQSSVELTIKGGEKEKSDK